MFGIKKNNQAVATKVKVEKLSGPRSIPEPVKKHLINVNKLDAELVEIFQAVMRRRPDNEKVFAIRIFDDSACMAEKVMVKDFTTLDNDPELILYEGWFDETTKQTELEEKNSSVIQTPILTEAEILHKIEALDKPGSTVVFFMGRGPAYGGPLGRGCAIVELVSSDAKKKKYHIYTANVIGTQPVAERSKLFDSEKPKNIATWIKEAHHKRLY